MYSYRQDIRKDRSTASDLVYSEISNLAMEVKIIYLYTKSWLMVILHYIILGRKCPENVLKHNNFYKLHTT